MCIWSVVNQLYSITTLRAEVREIEDAYVFLPFWGSHLQIEYKILTVASC